MQITVPIVLVALGGLILITQRSRWLLTGALLLQWLGIAWQVWLLSADTTEALVEVVTAIACCAILGVTVWNLRRGKEEYRPRFSIADQVWLWAVTLIAGVGGYGLARLYPLGGSEQDLTLFYWIILPAMLALVVDGARDPVRLGVGLLSVLNGAMFFVYTLSPAAPSIALLGLAALVRLAISAIAAYMWLFLSTTYREHNLNRLFDLRDGKVASQTALVPVAPEVVEQPGDMEGPDEDA